MLKTPKTVRCRMSDVLVALGTFGSGVERDIAPGFKEILHYSGDSLLWGDSEVDLYYRYPELVGLSCCGVCDSPDQFIAEFKDMLEVDVRTFCVMFTHVAKSPSNKGRGGGWRWHKWGGYIGKGVPSCEYLDDEDGFDAGVYVYHVYQLDGPEIQP